MSKKKTGRKSKSRAKTKPKTTKPMHNAVVLRKLEFARARLAQRSAAGGAVSSIRTWIALNEAGKAAIEQWLDACLDGESDWSPRRMLADLVEHFNYPYSPKGSSGFAHHLRVIYGERYDLATEMASKTRSDRR